MQHLIKNVPAETDAQKRIAQLAEHAMNFVVLDGSVRRSFIDALVARDEEALTKVIRGNSEFDEEQTEYEILQATRSDSFFDDYPVKP